MPESLPETDMYRLGVFLGAFVLFSCLEQFYPFRPKTEATPRRWQINFSMVVLGTVLIRLASTLLIYIGIELSIPTSWGLFTILDMNPISTAIASILVLDLAIYLQHRAFHKIPALWSIHKVHHTDLDLDASSALRFHPVEFLLSFLYRILLVIVFGIPIHVLIIFDTLLNLMAMFNHANTAIPTRIETYLRWLIVTPQMHIIHHSIEQTESDRNFGFNLSLWDRLFGTYTKHMSSPGIIGVKNYGPELTRRFGALLALPFRRNATGGS